MTLEAAKAFQTLAPNGETFNFVYISGEGATTQPGMFSAIFARVKGETELGLAEIRRQNPLFHAMSVRLGGVDASAHDAIKAYIPPKPLAARAIELLFPVLRTLVPTIMTPTEPLGHFLTELAMGKHKNELVAGPGITKIEEFPILQNSAFRRMWGI
ncbi:hypothetical protein F66182_3379 [Fusarium sp. NRRL 66182]|nr:hypothetical protein F66182_3379 [Fusarium sp. NRRL 66182]